MATYSLDKASPDSYLEPDMAARRTVTLGDVADVRTGPFGSALHESDYKHEGTPIVTVEHLGERGLTRQNLPLVGNSDVRRLAAYKCRAGDILFSRVGSIDRSARVSSAEEGWLFSGRLLRVRVTDPQTSPLFLSYLMSTEDFKNQVRSVAVGQTMPSLNTQILKNISLELPSLPQQISVAHTLADVDALVDGLQRQVAKKRAVKLGVMQQLLTGKTRLTGFTDPWHRIRLGDSGATYGGLTGKSKEDFGRGSASYVTFTEVMAGPWLRGAGLEPVAVKPSERQNRVAKSDVLFNGSSETPEEVALAAVVAFEPSTTTFLNSFCFGFRVKRHDLIDPTYLALYFRSSGGRALVSSLAQGATRYNIAKTKFLELAPELPPVDEQKAIAALIRDMEEEIDILRSRLSKARAVKQGIMQELLTGRTRLRVMETPS